MANNEIPSTRVSDIFKDLTRDAGTAEPEIAPEIEANRGLFAETGDAGGPHFPRQLWTD